METVSLSDAQPVDLSSSVDGQEENETLHDAAVWEELDKTEEQEPRHEGSHEVSSMHRHKVLDEMLID